MIELRDNYWAIEVPEGAEQFEVCNYGLNDTIEFVHKIDGVNAYRVDDLPPGTWQIICTLKDASYTQAAEIVESDGDGFKDYNEDNFHHDLPLMSPFDSLRSLLTVKGCDVNNNWLIIKKG
jgi:hypothetical protein